MSDASVIMCAGATTFTPLRDHGFPGAKVTVVGVGGLGHLAVKYAAHLGYQVTVFSTHEEKRAEVLSYGAT
jgi:D-arabinose 1-dehydrogenase-like Zn-dependent alcohol dehydrogenase